jgi:nucleoid-associated protein YgaU
MFGKVIIVALVAVLAWGVVARTSQGSGGEQVYVVKPADTLWSIAVAHYPGDPRDGVYELEKRNRLPSTTIRPGQRLILP